MKKHLIVLIVCLVAGISLNVNLKHNKTRSNRIEISLDNIEALANTEDPNTKCLYAGSLDCPVSTIKVQYLF
ncbi:NVEALA domain-containing protein [Parapedobacter koreensis]|uniref:NVEALA protein n=1 Tax=Parapedobacter koreensis TaxID=332977 RepID=A0A1H7F0S4_9SPHI|nr:NVEALA protein [Parapedobacter koreensis]